MRDAGELPDFLSHYYDARQGPFSNLSDLPLASAEKVLQDLRASGVGFASKRATDYMQIRTGLEERVRRLFIEKGGRPRRSRPHYMILGACPWVLSWYEQGRELDIPLAHFEAGIVSFTYGDTFPAMRVADGKPYRGQVYTLAELPGVVAAFGLPQDWNHDGAAGPERYIEAQVWADEPLRAFLQPRAGAP